MSITRAIVVGFGAVALGAPLACAAGPSATGSPAAPTPSKTAAPAAKGDAAIKDAIVGKWKSVDDTEVMEFAADGSARVTDPNAMFIAQYKVLDDGSLHLEVPAFGNNKDFTYRLELKGDELTLTLKDKKPRKYTRVK